MNYWVDVDRVFTPEDRDSFPLIHITTSWVNLRSILEEGFRPSYCSELITNNNKTKAACFPMISTSNVSMDFAMRYQKSYGTLGIALNKQWGGNKGFNPVLYLERKSDLTSCIIGNFENITATSKASLRNAFNRSMNNSKGIMTRQLIKIFAHSKNYDGVLVRGGEPIADNYPYGMEREWRLVILDQQVPYFLIGDDIDRKNDFNEVLKDVRIDFDLDDIFGFIVESEEQMDEIKRIVIEKYKLDNFPDRIKIEINNARHVPDYG